MIPSDTYVIQTSEVIVKALPESGGRRLVEVEASVEKPDLEGDIILQKALLDDAPRFIKAGHLDIDHYSEFGNDIGFRQRHGLNQPAAAYIVGNPVEVKDLGGGRTGVIGEIRKSIDGSHSPTTRKYDELWESLQSSPPVKWYASVFGKPTDHQNCNDGYCPGGATRRVVKSMEWRSLAFTRRPVCIGVKGEAQILAAKSFAAMGSMAGTPAFSGMTDLWKNRSCANCSAHSYPSVTTYRKHFEHCMGMPSGDADVNAHAVMYREHKIRAGFG